MGTAAVGTATALFHMSHEAADATKVVGNFSYITGFSVETSSALSYALGLMGKDLTDIQRPMIFFGKLLAAAKDGSVEARKSLEDLGVTKFDNFEAAFAQAAKKIDGTTNEVERLGLSVEGFGARGGAEMEKVFHKMGGDVTDFTRKAHDLGVTLSDEDVKAAKEFSATYNKVMFQASIAAHKFALAYGGEITSAMEDVSKTLSSNKDAWAAWGKEIKPIIGGVIDVAKDFASFLTNDITLAVWKTTTETGKWLALLKEALKLYHEYRGTQAAGEQMGPFPEDMNQRPGAGDADVVSRDSDYPMSSGGKSFLRPEDLAKSTRDNLNKSIADEVKKWEDDQKKRQNDREEFGKRDAAAQLANLKAQLSDAEKAFTEMHDRLMDKFKVDKDTDSLTAGLSGAWRRLRDEGVALIKQIKDVQGTIDKTEGATPNEVSGHAKDADRLTAELQAQYEKSKADLDKSLDEDKKKGADEFFKKTEERNKNGIQAYKAYTDQLIAIEDTFLSQGMEKESEHARKVGQLKIHELEVEKTLTMSEVERGILDQQIGKARQEMAQNVSKAIDKETKAENDKTEALQKQREEMDKLAQDFLMEEGAKWGAAQKGSSPLANSIDELQSRMESVKDIKSSLKDMGTIGVDAFESMTAAVGDAIAQWALYGGSIAQALKQALAAELAHIAAVATVRALYSTAYGFMRLAEHDWAGAAHAFTAAALWAALAAGTALGARALSGAGHKQEQGAGTGNSTGSSANNQQDPTPYSRASSNIYMSGRRDAAAEAIDKLTAKLDSMRPGDVLTTGMRQRPGAVGQQVVKDIGGDAKIGRNILSKSGVR
jgi:hypothetical protein